MVSRGKIGTAKATNPASSGPAGSEFEAQVGATYLLAMLLAAEPLGLPGTVVDSVELQRAGEGFPLDDVIIHAHDASGATAILEIQVKRTLSFARGDTVFRRTGTNVERDRNRGAASGAQERTDPTVSRQFSMRCRGAFKAIAKP